MSSGSIVDGAQDFIGAKTFQAGNSSAQHNSAGVVSAQVVSTGNSADQTEDILQTFSLPANALSANGKGVRIRAWGTTAANADNKQVKVYFGASTFATGVAAANAKDWHVDLTVFRTGASTQTILGQGNFNASAVPPVVSAGANDETTALTIKCTGQDSSANTANAIVCKAMIVEFLN